MRPRTRMGVPAYVHLLRAKDLIDSAYAQPLDIRRLAATALASEAHFIRSFRRAFGETPHRYLLRRRIERAKDLLRGTDLSVTEVSLAVGFQSLGSFSSAFRELTGEPPSVYRRRWEPGAPPVPACFALMWTVFEKPPGGDAHSVSGDHDPEVLQR